MIIVMSPVPSISYEYNINELLTNKEVDATSINHYVYSKGIHSARTIKILQDEPLVLSALGGISGKTIKHQLDKFKIKADIVWTDVNTPQKIRLYEVTSKNNYLINTLPENLRPRDFSSLTLKLKSHIKKISTMIISDEFNVTSDYDIGELYKQWSIEAKKNNVKVIFSTGKLCNLKKICTTKPYCLVFTQNQLIELGYDISSREQIVSQLLPLTKEGIHYIAIYLRDQSSIIIAKNKCYMINYIGSINNELTNYFGGVFLGSFAIGINRKYEIEKIGKLSLSAAISATSNANEPIITRKSIESLSSKTKVTLINI